MSRGDAEREQQMSRDVVLGSRGEAVVPWCDLAVLPGAWTLFYSVVPQTGVPVTAHHEKLWDRALRGEQGH